MIELVPAIMPENLEDLEEKLGRVFRYVPLVQLDIMDGVFVKGKTWPYVGDKGDYQNMLNEEEGLPFWDKVDFEIDLMISKPEEKILDWIIIGASRVIVHIESTKKMEDVIRQINDRFSGKKDIELGIALNIDTPTETILPYLEDIDFVQFMGIAEIGRQGEDFDERVLDKVRDFHNAHPEVIISVDGGVNLDTALQIIQAGAKKLVSGSAILESVNIPETIQSFKKLALI